MPPEYSRPDRRGWWKASETVATSDGGGVAVALVSVMASDRSQTEARYEKCLNLFAGGGVDPPDGLSWWRHADRKRYGVTSLQAEVEHP